MQVVIDKRLERKLGALQAGSAPSKPTIGIVIGHAQAKCSGDPAGSTNSPRAEDAAERRRAGRAAKAKASSGHDDIISATGDSDWIAHHCRQAVRMLPGGLDVVGLFVSCDKRQYGVLQPTLFGALKRCSRLSAQIGSMSTVAPTLDMVLLVLDPSSGLSAQHVNLPATDQMGGTHVQLNAARVTHQLIHGSARFLLDGELRGDDENLTRDLSGKSNKKSAKAKSAETFDATILMPSLSQQDDSDAQSYTSNACGSMTLKCTVDCLAVVPARPGTCVRHAIDALRTDLVRSLYTRAELHYESMCVVEGESSDPLAIHQLPRRVFIQAGGDEKHEGGLSLVDFCDYLFESDGIDDVQENAQHCLDVKVQPAQVRASSEQAATPNLLDRLNIMSLPAVSDSNDLSNESDTGSNYSARRLSLHGAGAEDTAKQVGVNFAVLTAVGAVLAAVIAVVVYYLFVV